MKNWTNSSDYISSNEIDDILKKIKTKVISSSDIDKVVCAITNNSEIEKMSFDYAGVSFTGNYQQKLLLTISNTKFNDAELRRSADFFKQYFNDFTYSNIDTIVVANGESSSIALFSCIIEDIGDVFFCN